VDVEYLPGTRGVIAERKVSPYFGRTGGKELLFILELVVALDVLLFKGLLFVRERLGTCTAPL
jgi:hypothetical protein